MRKLFTLFLALVATANLWADEFQIGYISYEITGENTVELDYADDEITQVVIPNTVSYRGKTYRVTSIGSDAFYDCAKLTSVTIGDYVKNIRQDAFAECTALTSLTMGSKVQSIGEIAFVECKSLTSVTLPSSVTHIGTEAFAECTALQSITLGSGVTHIGQEAFALCNSLQRLSLPASLTHIGNSAFGMCDRLYSVIYKGTKEQWHKIAKGKELNYDSPVSHVTCTNGSVDL